MDIEQLQSILWNHNNWSQLDDKLKELGAVDGDTVTLCDFEFDYYE